MGAVGGEGGWAGGVSRYVGCVSLFQYQRADPQTELALFLRNCSQNRVPAAASWLSAVVLQLQRGGSPQLFDNGVDFSTIQRRQGAHLEYVVDVEAGFGAGDTALQS